MLATEAPRGQAAIEQFLLEVLPAAGPPPRGKPGLERARRFFALAGDPQHSARQIHVVGTAGKGTAVGAIVGKLVGAGCRVGSHMSPHVYDLRERFLFDGQLPSWSQVDQAMSELWPALVALEDEDGRPPSFFELTTALAWVIGRSGDAEYLCTEAGIGGRFDATNTISRSDKLTVVMPIGYDHLEILGTELETIAADKADVIPVGGTVIMAPQRYDEAAEVVVRVCAERNADLIEVDRVEDWADQAEIVASAVVSVLDPTLLTADAESAPVHLPGRMETIEVEGKHFVLDGAHNPMKLRGVRGALDAGQASVLMAALSYEKDLAACAAEMAAIADVVVASDFAVTAGDRVVRRSWSAVDLARAIKAVNPAAEVHVVPEIERAVTRALMLASEGETVLATGSFMMLEPARDAVRVAAQG